MPLKKYNTTSLITMPSRDLNSTDIKQCSSSSSPKSGSSSCSSPPEVLKAQNYFSNDSYKTESSIASQMCSLTKLMPSIIEAAASAGTQANKDLTRLDGSTESSLPVEIKSRLHTIFNQIEQEFDSLYAENVRLQQELIRNANSKSPQTNSKTSNKLNNTCSTSTLVANNQKTHNPQSPNSPKRLILEKSMSQPSSVLSSVLANMVVNKQPNNESHKNSNTSNLSKPTTGFSKTRINNLSFPKFRPNAREFIMQSIKNTSAQIVNKTQNNSSTTTSKLQCTLSGHKDGIWDINCLSIPTHLFSSTNNNFNNVTNNQNLLIGTASADSTARLWYLNSHSSERQSLSSQSSNVSNQLSPQTMNQLCPNTNLQTSGFCIQQYCGHTGSVNSIRFHPRFFTDATNLILTASGDSQAHIWQCILSPVNDSLESTSEVVLNYNNCYSFAMQNSPGTCNLNGIGSPPNVRQQLQHTSTTSNLMQSQPNNRYQELISNTPIIRSPIKRYEGHADVCIAAEWFPDGELLTTASWDRTANVYNVETGKVLCTLQHDDLLTNVNIHPVQKIILTSSKDTTFKVWDFRDPICSVNVYQGHNRSVNSAIFVNEDKIATSSDDQTVKLWDLRIMRSPVCTINLNSGVNRICTMSPNQTDQSTSETYLCLPLDNRDVKIYNLQGERITRLPRNNRSGHQRLVTSLASFNNLLLSASFDRVINCWSVDYNPPKSSSSASTSNSVKFNSNNKENNMNNSEINQMNTPLSQNNLIPNDQALMSSCPQQSKPYEFSPKQNRMSMSYYEAFSQPPLTHITNNSSSNVVSTTSKSGNTLSKLAERIKI